MNEHIIAFSITGIIFGLTAGLSPGPILTLVISETIRNSKKEGYKVAVVPLISDIPVVLLCLYILNKVAKFNMIVGIIALFGAVFIAILALDSFKAVPATASADPVSKTGAFKKGLMANLFSPHPYMFWLTIGAPTVFKALSHHFWAGIGYIGWFYICLVGSKVVVAYLVDRSKSFLKSTAYVYILKFLGLALLGFSVYFLYEGLNLLGLIARIKAFF